MRTEYRRDLDHNYLVLHGEREVDTASYQVRMLVGNTIPSILKCRLQGLDGETLFYYEITSRQSVASMYEQKKFGKEDLRLLFGGFVQVMEEMGEYLLNPGYLVLQPEYMFLDVEKRQMGFCYFPGEEREVRSQLQELTEYVLPRLDHQDAEAVMLGYGVYRRALEDSFHLENIKEELYQERGLQEKEFQDRGSQEKTGGDPSGEGLTDLFQTDAVPMPEEEENLTDPRIFERFSGKEEKRAGNKKKSSLWKMLVSCMASAAGMLLFAAGSLLGYLPRPGMEGILMGALICLAGGTALYLILQKITVPRKQEAEWKKKVQKTRRQESGEAAGREEAAGRLREEEKWIRGERPGTETPAEARIPEPSGQEKKSFPGREVSGGIPENAFGETVVLSSMSSGPVSLVSREPGELATIYLTRELTVIGKLESASDAVIPEPTVSRVHAKIRCREGEYYLTDLNSRNGTSVNGRMLRGDEEYQLQNEDEVDFARARYVFLK